MLIFQHKTGLSAALRVNISLVELSLRHNLIEAGAVFLAEALKDR